MFNPDMLDLAIKLRALNSQAVADATGIPKQRIDDARGKTEQVAIEFQGKPNLVLFRKRAPVELSREEIAKIGKLLYLPVSFFERQDKVIRDIWHCTPEYDREE